MFLDHPTHHSFVHTKIMFDFLQSVGFDKEIQIENQSLDNETELFRSFLKGHVGET